jgi:hypothetical protein
VNRGAHVDGIHSTPVKSGKQALNLGGDLPLHQEEMKMKDNKAWFEIDSVGLGKTLAQQDKFGLITELVSNSWDADGVTQVDITLTRPDESGITILTCVDNSPKGWSNLAHAHTMYAESDKKGLENKRGRFNEGEKKVVARSIESSLTTTTGTVIWNADKTRTETTDTRPVGSEFVGKYTMTLQEWERVCHQARLLLTPRGIRTTFNGTQIKFRKDVGQFTDKLPCPLPDKEGNVRNVERQAIIHIYDLLSGEQAMIFEMGIPIVELGDDKYHVNVMQKVPLSRDRDNVNPSYLRRIRAGVLNIQFGTLKPEELTASWTNDALSIPKDSGHTVKDEVVQHVMKARFGENHVTRSVSDVGSAREAVSRGHNVVEGGALPKEVWARYKAVTDENGDSVVRSSGQLFPTDSDHGLDRAKVIPNTQWTEPMKAYAALIEMLSPKLIGKPSIVQFLNDKDEHIEGCFFNVGEKTTRKGFNREFGVFTVNLAYIDPSKPQKCYELLLHELAHDVVRCNDHLDHRFYDTVTELGAKLAVLIQEEPELFDIGSAETEPRIMFTGKELVEKMSAVA